MSDGICQHQWFTAAYDMKGRAIRVCRKCTQAYLVVAEQPVHPVDGMPASFQSVENPEPIL